MVLGFKQKFADGTDTHFLEKILSISGLYPYELFPRPKIHTFRTGERWKPGMSIQMAYGVRTQHYAQFNKGISALGTCISTQKVSMTTFWGCIRCFIDGRELPYTEIGELAQNDGLTLEQFRNWFFPDGNYEWSGQIIHWTGFKY